jgi:hypothetical protein
LPDGAGRCRFLPDRAWRADACDRLGGLRATEWFRLLARPGQRGRERLYKRLEMFGREDERWADLEHVPARARAVDENSGVAHAVHDFICAISALLLDAHEGAAPEDISDVETAQRSN